MPSFSIRRVRRRSLHDRLAERFAATGLTLVGLLAVPSLVGCGWEDSRVDQASADIELAEPAIVAGESNPAFHVATNSGPLGGKPVAADIPSSASHLRMLAVLKAAAANDGSNPYTGTDRLNDCLAKLDIAIAQGNVRFMMLWHAETAAAYSLLGNTKESLVHIRSAEKYADYMNSLRPGALDAKGYEYLYYIHALAAFRKGEEENCIHCTDGQGCLFPIAGTGVHQRREGSIEAIEFLEKILQNNPQHAASIWLLNMAHMTLGTFPDGVPEQFRFDEGRWKSESEFPRFRNVASDRGIDTLSLSGGAVAEDFDGDGHLDFLVSDWSIDGQLHFFRGGGDGTFARLTEASNLTGISGGLNLVQADFDNDGDMDVLVLRGAWLGVDIGAQPNSLLRNDGHGRFEDVTFDVGLASAKFPTQTAAFADYDLDGDLDLYIGNEALPNQLFANDGTGQFTNIAKSAGVDDEGFTKGVAWGDINGDGRPDLYVSNLAGVNKLYHNNGDGTFTDQAAQRGVEMPNQSFAAWFWDYDNDGDEDLMNVTFDVGLEYMLADYLADPAAFGLTKRGEGDYLFENDGDGNFQNVAPERGLDRTSQTMGCNFGDLDNDGYLDFYLGTGFTRLEAVMPNLMYRSEAGQRFANVTTAGGFGHLQKGHGVAFADFDEDGDQDVLVELGGAYKADQFNNALFENPGFGNHWIKIRLRGESTNRYGVGAKLKLVIEENGERREIHRTVGATSSFGGNPLRQEIGLGSASHVQALEVFWPKSQIHHTYSNVPSNQQIELNETGEVLVGTAATAGS